MIASFLFAMLYPSAPTGKDPRLLDEIGLRHRKRRSAASGGLVLARRLAVLGPTSCSSERVEFSPSLRRRREYEKH